MPIFAEREKKAARENERAEQPQHLTLQVTASAPELTHAEKQEGQKRMVQEGMLWAVMNNATVPGGIVLTAFALYIGADVFIIGLLTALPLLAAILQLWAPQMVSAWGGRKAVTVTTLGIARLSLIPLVAISLGAWMVPELSELWLILFLVLLTVFSGLTAI